MNALLEYSSVEEPECEVLNDTASKASSVGNKECEEDKLESTLGEEQGKVSLQHPSGLKVLLTSVVCDQCLNFKVDFACVVK